MSLKKMVISMVVFFMFATLSYADMEYMINRINLLDPNCATNGACVETTLTSTTLTASDSAYVIIDLGDERMRGYTSLDLAISGTGTLRVYHESSNGGTNYNTAIVDGTTADDIITAFSAGNEFYQFGTPLCELLKINFLETGGANSVVLGTAILATQ